MLRGQKTAVNLLWVSNSVSKRYLLAHQKLCHIKSIKCHVKTPLAAFFINLLSVINSVLHKIGHFEYVLPSQSEHNWSSTQLPLLHLSRLFQNTFKLLPSAVHRVVHIIFCYRYIIPPCHFPVRHFPDPQISLSVIYRSYIFSVPVLIHAAISIKYILAPDR